MWHKSLTIQTNEATREQIWAVLTNINRWNEWDDELEWTKLDGEPRLNADFYLKPKGGPKTRITITQFDKPAIFADISHLPLAKMETIHTLSETSKGVEIAMEIRISGLLTFLWSKVIGKGQIGGGKVQIQRLIDKAKTI
ncbi:MAG: SRPBCC family protein [Bacteroidales bacterium]